VGRTLAALAIPQKIVSGLIVAGAVVGLFYFSQRYGSVLKTNFSKEVMHVFHLKVLC